MNKVASVFYKRSDRKGFDEVLVRFSDGSTRLIEYMASEDAKRLAMTKSPETEQEILEKYNGIVN